MQHTKARIVALRSLKATEEAEVQSCQRESENRRGFLMQFGKLRGSANGSYQTTQLPYVQGRGNQIDEEDIVEELPERDMARTGFGYPKFGHFPQPVAQVFQQDHNGLEVDCYSCSVGVGGAVGQSHYEKEERDSLGRDTRVWNGAVEGLEGEGDSAKRGGCIVGAVGQGE